jgi:hypothetical protein
LLLEAVGIRVPVVNIKDLNTYYSYFSGNNRPSIRCALAADEICNNANMLDNLEHQFYG